MQYDWQDVYVEKCLNLNLENILLVHSCKVFEKKKYLIGNKQRFVEVSLGNIIHKTINTLGNFCNKPRGSRYIGQLALKMMKFDVRPPKLTLLTL